MAARLRGHDWARSELGDRPAWPHSLNLALNICLDSHFPIAVWWGPRLIQFYNDAYQPILGDEKDVTAFGGAAIDSWREIWPTIGPMVDQVMHQGRAVRGEDLPLHIHRDGALGLAHFTFSYSPIRDETGAVVGMFTAAVETTARVALEQRQAFRLALAEALRQVADADAALRAAGDALSAHLDAHYIGYAEPDPACQRAVLRDIGGTVASAALHGPALAALGAALEAGQPLRIDDAEGGGGDLALAVPDLGALLVLPLRRDGGAAAALVVGKRAAHRWTDAQVQTAQESLDQLEGAVSRLRAEQLVRKQLGSEVERLRRLFDQAPSFIAVTRGPQHVYELANAAYLLAIGHRDILDKPIRDALPELAGQGFFELLDHVYTTGVPYIAHGMPVRLQRAPGGPLEELMLDFIYQPVTDAEGRISGILVEGSDVTSQYRAQAELVRERDRTRHILSSMKEGFAVIDNTWTVRQVNEEGLRLARRGREDVLGHHYWEVWPGLHGTEAVALFRRVLETNATETKDFRIAWPDGQQVWLEIRAYPSLEGGLAFFFRDITERKSAQQQLRDADLRKDEFLAMLAHELRNPLAPISAAADLLRLPGIDAPRLRQTSGIISRQVKHMTSLVDDLMDVSRVTRGLVTLEQRLLDVRQIVTDAVEQTRPLIEARRHALAVSLPDEAAGVHGDQKRLVQVLTNLLNNAAKYTPEGGTIGLDVGVTAAVVRCTVRDNGIGMDADLMGKVFELFMQAERSSDRSQGGLGIGLALVKSLVELHRGTVSVRSDGAGLGSEFTVALPRAAFDEQTFAPAPGAAAPAPHGLRIMVVDDNVDAAQMLALLLESTGHRVTVEHSPYAALRRLQDGAIDVFLLDIGLPQMDGYELAQRLRQQPNGATATFIAITGYGQEADRRSSQSAGFSYHFLKPVDAAGLARLLGTLAGERRPPPPP
ncbi:PAS domain S-box-containing protein [Pseudoduganella lurida]|uniref:histidine kinase n=2 Tax=Pseudoduganella lurida TaxID=1036180 RepID=A0A562R0L4_9BURK|nr:PAS domain S-box-containing protein [Pseudoduganella lurida]